MKDSDHKTMNYYSRREEIANSLTHGAGAVLSLLGLVYLLIRAVQLGNAWHVVSFSIYGVSLFLLYLASTLYHSIPILEWKRVLKKLDHSAIFLLIAGTVTPFALLTISGTLATVILIAVWTGAVVGIAIELLWIGSPKWVSVIVYLVVGWIGAVAFPAIVGSAGIAAGLLIATGGILYTVGAVVYATRRPDPVPSKFGYHEVFHLLVVGAAGAHFAAVALFAL